MKGGEGAGRRLLELRFALRSSGQLMVVGTASTEEAVGQP